MTPGGDSGLATGAGEFLFAEDTLSRLSRWPEISEMLRSKNLKARPLRPDDYRAGYLKVLSQLTHVGTVSSDNFKSRFEQMKKINLVRDHYVIVVIEDEATNQVVATSTLLLEYKFIHECAIRARLEDVAVLTDYRKKQIGEIIVKIIVELAREAYGCYKLSLDCRDELIKFYSKNNFTYGSNMLAIRFHD